MTGKNKGGMTDLKKKKVFAFQSLKRASRGKVAFSDAESSLRLWQSYSRKRTIATAEAIFFKTVQQITWFLQSYRRPYTRFKMRIKIPAGHKFTTGTKFISQTDKLHKFAYCSAALKVGFSLTTYFSDHKLRTK